MDGRRTTKRQYSEYSDFFVTQREPEYDQDTDLQQRESTHDGWGGQDGRREPDSGLGHTQDYRSQWTREICFNPDSVSQRIDQPASHKCRVGYRPAGDRIAEETDGHGDSRWDIPRKRALFTSDGTDITTFGSNTPESRADRAPVVEYSERLLTDKRQGEGRTKRPCSSYIQLEMAVSQLQRDVEDCRAERELARNQTQAATNRSQRRSRYTSTPVPRYSGKSDWEQYRAIFEAIVCSNGWDDVTAALLPSEWRCTQRGFCCVVPGFLLKSLSDHYNSPGRLAEYKWQFQRVVRRPRDDPSIYGM